MQLRKVLQKTAIVAMTCLMALTPDVMGGVKVSADTNIDESSINIKAKSAIAVDAETGQIIYGQNENEPLAAASMTKILSAYLVLEAVHNGKLKWNQKIPVRSAAQKVSQDTSLSNVPLKSDHEYTVRSLYQATLIYSANGAIMALGDAIAGSQKNFVNMMRKKARSFGIKDAKIYTCNGLPNGLLGKGAYPGIPADAENEFSARDMAIMATRLLKDYPEVLKTTKIQHKKFNNGTSYTVMNNWNWMLPGLVKAYTALPVDGLKTGTSDKAKACFTGTVKKDGHRIITVVMGASHKSQTDLSRFVETQKLMSYVYNSFTYKTIKKGTKIKGAAVKVETGKEETAPIVTGKKTHIWVRNDLTPKYQATTKISKDLVVDHKLQAPVDEGEKVGTMTIKVKGQDNKNINGAKGVQVKAVAKEDIKKANIFVRMWRGITNIF